MPSYPDMTLAELADLVAYLQSLQGGAHDPHAHHRVTAGGNACDPNRPQAFSYVLQAEEVTSEQLRAFDESEFAECRLCSVLRAPGVHQGFARPHPFRPRATAVRCGLLPNR